MTEKLLIIFVKNPHKDHVKTRLASTMGKEAALHIYQELLKQTRKITGDLSTDKVVYYSDFKDLSDVFEGTIYQKRTQKGVDLGARMQDAFTWGFSKGYKKICIIGSDCFELTGAHIEEAFSALKNNDAVVGPAEDGGYYLLGIKKVHQELFENKQWSTSTVAEDSIKDLKNLGLDYVFLDTLKDVDFEADIPAELKARLES